MPRGFLRRDGSRFLLSRNGHRCPAGAARLGHLVDLGRQVDRDPCSLAYLRFVLSAAQGRGWRRHADARCFGGDLRLL
jgi:hypothetical protein